MDYSAQHLSAFARYRENGWRLDGLSAAQLDALLEDEHFQSEIAKWRQKRLARASDPPTPRQVHLEPATSLLQSHFDTYTNALFDALIPIWKRQKDQIAGLESEIAQLKARPLQKWAGVHVAGMQYSEASLVTKGGSLWAAMTTTTTTPGEPGGDWRLIVKKGTA